jgi:hypothetical protein
MQVNPKAARRCFAHLMKRCFSKKWRIKNWGWKKGKSWEEEALHQINWVESNIPPRFQGVLPVQGTHGSTGNTAFI